MFQTFNPLNGSKLAEYSYEDDQNILEILKYLRRSYEIWGDVSIEIRSQYLKLVAEELRKEKASLAQLINQEMGKKLSEAEGEVEKSATACDYYAQNATIFLKPESNIIFQPFGVIFGIMPWNFPVWQTIRFAAPAIVAGNITLHKPAEITAGVGIFIQKCFDQALVSLLNQNSEKLSALKGYSHFRVFQAVLMNHEQAARVIASPQIAAVSFTGSTKGGKSVATIAGQNLKKIVLELGGSDPYLVFQDADVSLAVEKCVQGKDLNNGQSCIAAKRMIIHASVFDQFVQEYVKQIAIKPIAPVAHKKFQNQIHEQIQNAVSNGAKLILGGVKPEGSGALYPHTVLLIEKDFEKFSQEEIFGPVALVMKVQDDEQAIRVANQTCYGLGAAVFTTDSSKSMIAARALECGMVAINDFVRSRPDVPFGGIKNSGFGKELGKEGLFEFVNRKVILSELK